MFVIYNYCAATTCSCSLPPCKNSIRLLNTVLTFALTFGPRLSRFSLTLHPKDSPQVFSSLNPQIYIQKRPIGLGSTQTRPTFDMSNVFLAALSPTGEGGFVGTLPTNAINNDEPEKKRVKRSRAIQTCECVCIIP
jgi:hypothetical protein